MHLKMKLILYVSVQEDMDPLEMLEAVNILDRIAKDFFEKIVITYRNSVRFQITFTNRIIGVETMERPKRSVGRYVKHTNTKSKISCRRGLF